jgi:hypothetical protein
MQEIKKISLIPIAKIAGLFGVLIGIFQGVLMGQLSMQYAQEGVSLTLSEAFEYIATSPMSGTMPLFIAIGWWSIVVAPIILGIGYFVSGIVLAWIYNMFVKLVGGIKIEINENKKKK